MGRFISLERSANAAPVFSAARTLNEPGIIAPLPMSLQVQAVLNAEPASDNPAIIGEGPRSSAALIARPALNPPRPATTAVGTPPTGGTIMSKPNPNANPRFSL